MGTDIDNELNGPGWYDLSTNFDYENNDFDYEKTKEYGLNKIGNNISKSINNPLKAFTFYIKKIASQYCDPLFESIWIGPIDIGNGLNTKTDLLTSLYSGERVEDIVVIYCKCILMVIYACAFLYAIKNLKNNPITVFFLLYFIGGFTFHLFSEAKSQYIMVYVYLLIPLVGYEINKTIDYYKNTK